MTCSHLKSKDPVQNPGGFNHTIEFKDGSFLPDMTAHHIGTANLRLPATSTRTRNCSLQIRSKSHLYRHREMQARHVGSGLVDASFFDFDRVLWFVGPRVPEPLVHRDVGRAALGPV